MNKPNPYKFDDPLHWLARCDVCGWPIAEDRSQGCGEFDCSMRPQPNGYGLNHSERLAARAEIRRLETALRTATAEVSRLEGICNKAAGAIITKKYKAALAAVMSGVPDAASSRLSPDAGIVDHD